MEGTVWFGFVSAVSFFATFGILTPTKGGPRGFMAARARLYLGSLGILHKLASSKLLVYLGRYNMLTHAAQRLTRRLGLSTLSLFEQLSCCLVGVCGMGLLVSLLSASLGVGIVAMMLCFFVLIMWDKNQDKQEQADILKHLPGVYRTLASALGSGETLSQAIGYVGKHETGCVGVAFTRASLKLSCGEPIREVLKQLTQDLQFDGAGFMQAALLISQVTGSPLQALFLRVAHLLEKSQESKRVLLVKTAQVRLSIKVITIFPLVLIGVLSLISPDFRAGLVTPLGIGCLIAAAVLSVCAQIIFRHILREVER